MSAIAGICYWDGRPIDDSDLATLASHSRAAGPDGGGTVAPNPGLALQAHVLHFDRLSKLERQPHVFAQGSIITWDGRLDNRDDLLIALHYELGPDFTDVALVAAAYARWGLDCLPRLIGDWSLALWDAPNRRIILARDYVGNRPLHYLEIPGGFAWATSLDALADCFDLYRKPDESYIASKLVGGGVPSDLTPFSGARALRAGHMLLASQTAGVEVRRYWTFHPSRIRYRDPVEYTDHLRTLLAEAMRVRLRASGRVWSHLSGGFDSSTIVCLAQALIERGQVEASTLQPISMVVSSSPESDENKYITAVERWCKLTTIRREFTDPFPRFADLVGRRRPFTVGSESVLEAPMVATGDRIVLSGEMGDLVMLRGAGLEDGFLFELLHEGRLKSFLRLSFARARRRQRPWPRLLMRAALMTYLPRLHSAFEARRNKARRARELGISADRVTDRGVTAALLRQVPRKEDHRYPSVSAFPVAKRGFVTGLYRMTDHPASSNLDYLPEIWRTFPFTHRSLVEFVMAVPQLALWDPLATRAGMKRALSAILPPDVIRRTSKGEPTTVHARIAITRAEQRIGAMPGELPAAWHLVTRGYLRADALQGDLELLASGKPRSESFLHACLQLEAWLRTVDSFERKQTQPPASAALFGTRSALQRLG
jgi:hypothetical protein